MVTRRRRRTCRAATSSPSSYRGDPLEPARARARRAGTRTRRCYDALHDREVTDDWLDLLRRAGRRRPGSSAPVAPGVEPLPERRPEPGADRRAVQHLAGLRRRDVLKVFRRLAPGAATPTSRCTPALGGGRLPARRPRPVAGWIDATRAATSRCSGVPAGGIEGWDLATSSVRDLCARPTCTPTRSAATSPPRRERLGEVTAEVHAALRRVAARHRAPGTRRAGGARVAAARPTSRAPCRGPGPGAVRQAWRARLRRPAPAARPSPVTVQRDPRRPPPRPDDADRHRLEAARLRGRAGPPGRASGAPWTARCATSRACSAPSTTPPTSLLPTPAATPQTRVPRRRVGRAQPRRVLRRATPRRPGVTPASDACCCARSRPTRPSTRSSTRPASARAGCRSRSPRSPTGSRVWPPTAD